MNKVSILIPHFKTHKWTAICVWHFLQYPMPIPFEIIVVDNSPGHSSIECITKTELGLDPRVKVVSGDPTFTSHGMGYDIAASHATGDWFFTAETDSFPTRHDWSDEYIKASVDHQLIGPEIPQSSGRYVHPAGALMSRAIYDAALRWQETIADWVFVPCGGLSFGFNKPYHVVALKHRLPDGLNADGIALWRKCGPYQEMRSFDADDWGTYPDRDKIRAFYPEGEQHIRKIGYEAGQWLCYFADASTYFRVLRTPVHIEWMAGHSGKQAEYSSVFNGAFRHVWCGTVSTVSIDGLAPDVKAHKLAQCDLYFSRLPNSIAEPILSMIRDHEILAAKGAA